MTYRIERDALGEKQVPAGAYWGIHTQRAIDNFCLSSFKVSPVLLNAMTRVKMAACLTNAELGYLSSEKAKVIQEACQDVLEGKLQEVWPLDALQGGAGTSTHMNVNEVIANRANELLGKPLGQKAPIHPLEDVNLHQSTNDVYPTALKIAAIDGLKELSQAAARLQGAFQAKEKEFAPIVKIGRTEMQPAVPMTLGSEFGAFAEAVGRDRWRTFKCEERLRMVNLGGTAVGTGLGAPRRYIFLVIEKLREVTGLGLGPAENRVDLTANMDPFVEVSGILKALATNLIKISEDLRLLSALGEIRIPAVQEGSSIMPGKVNPVILEAVIQAGIKTVANDLIVTETAARGSMQINEFLPLLAHALLESLALLARASEMLAVHVAGIQADPERCRKYLDQSETLITAFLPEIGYDRCGELLQEYRQNGGIDLRAFLEQKLGEARVTKILSPQNLTSMGYNDRGKSS